MASTGKTRKWAELKKTLSKWEQRQLVELVKDLYDAAPINRDFLHARLLADADDDSVLGPYRERIVTQFFPKRGDPKLNLGEARKAIREYHKATGNAAGTVTLMLEYVECGASFANEYGEDSQAFYSSLESVLKELVTLLLEAEPDLCLQFRDRLSQFARIANRLGWCFGDVVSEQMGLLDDHFDEFTDPLIDESPRTE